jgi:hypothetical protein
MALALNKPCIPPQRELFSAGLFFGNLVFANLVSANLANAIDA